MIFDSSHIVAAMVIGIGATLIMDAWALLMKHAFNIPSLNYCVVGRWIGQMPAGVFKHASIFSSPQKRWECPIGWTAHYAIGIAFAVAFLLLVSPAWLQQPTLVPALAMGVATVLMPFLIMQPSFGLGVAAAKAPSPNQARFRSLMAHASFGFGLYLSALALRPFMLVYA